MQKFDYSKLVSILKPQNSIGLDSLIYANPFDDLQNICKLITTDVYFDSFYVETDEISDMISKIDNIIKDDIKTTLYLFLHGPAGIGKTSLLQYYIRHNKTFIHEYIDIPYYQPTDDQDSIGAVSSNFTLDELKEAGLNLIYRKSRSDLEGTLEWLKLFVHHKNNTHPIRSTLRNYLIQKSEQDENRTLSNLLLNISHKVRNIQTIFSYRLSEVLRIDGERHDYKNYIYDILLICSLDDLIIIFILFIIKSMYKPNTKLIIYLDNLDSIDLDYIAGIFSEHLQQTSPKIAKILNENLLFDHNINFIQEIKFVFCLREATFLVLNPHFSETISRYVKKLRFNHNDDSLLCQKVMLKRLDIAENVFLDRDKPNILNAINNIKDILNVEIPFVDELDELPKEGSIPPFIPSKYFNTVFSPLYNSDIKKLMALLVNKSTDNEFYLEMKAILNPDATYVPDEKLKQLTLYGLGGDWMFSIAKSIYSSEFAKRIFGKISQEDNEEGYCLLFRMMLLVILDKCQWSYGNMAVIENISLYDLIGKLIGMYNLDEILDCVIESFLCYQSNMIYTITIENHKIAEKTDLDEIKEFENKYFFRGKSPKERVSEWRVINSEDKFKCKNINIKITKAGFTFLKYVLIHFEFYSVIAGNNKSLFSSKYSTKDKRYEFIHIINNVYNLVKTHCQLMHDFYNNVIKEKLKIKPEEYKAKYYAFKYLGRPGTSRKQFGHFHITRLVNSMIGYIDQYRIFLSKTVTSKNERIIVNKILTIFIDKFTELHSYSDDPISEGFYQEFKKTFAEIKAKNYDDDFKNRFSYFIY